MKSELSDKVIGYHYSNPRAYQSMQEGWEYGEVGLIPIKRFVSLRDGESLPNEAYDSVIEGLLKPEPKSWLENPEFQHLWNFLMHDICKTNKVMLLSFQLKLQDKAYVVDRAHVERELYRESKGQGKPTRESKNEVFRKYWESRVPVFEYNGSYSLPQLSIWTPIEFDRLKVEWIKSSREVWERVLENDW